MKGFGTTTAEVAAAALHELLLLFVEDDDDDEEEEKNEVAANGVVGVEGWGGKSVRVGVHRGDDPLQSSRVWKRDNTYKITMQIEANLCSVKNYNLYILNPFLSFFLDFIYRRNDKQVNEK